VKVNNSIPITSDSCSALGTMDRGVGQCSCFVTNLSLAMMFLFYSLLFQLKWRTSRSKQKLLGWRISICKQRVVGQSSKVCLYARYLMISYVPGCRVWWFHPALIP